MRSVVYSMLILGGALGVARLAGYRLPYLGVIALYMAIYAVVDLARRRHRTDSQVVGEEWPTSGPIGRFGQRGLVVAFAMTGLLALLNPFQLTQIVRQAVGDRRAERRSPESKETQIVYSLPFDGEWLVYNGGTTEATSHSWHVVAQRYAYDFVVADDEVGRHTGPGTKVTDYHAYGRPILAAADGTVIAVEGNIRNAPFVGYGIVDFASRSFFGNYVMVEHGPAEYGFYAHLAPGSPTVEVGDRVVRGQPLGVCGHSGHSSEPHLHFQVQDTDSLYDTCGLSIRFGDIEVNGDNREVSTLQVGDRVRNPPGSVQ